MKSMSRGPTKSISRSSHSPVQSGVESPAPVVDVPRDGGRNVIEMQKKIEQRQRELEKKRKQLEDLRARGTGEGPTSKPNPVKAASLLNEVLAAIASARPADVPKDVASVPEVKLTTRVAKPSLQTFLPRNLSISSGAAVEVYPPVNLHFDKTVQADFAVEVPQENEKIMKPMATDRGARHPARGKSAAFTAADLTVLDEPKRAAKITEMSESDKATTIASPEFINFVGNSSKLVERVLNETEVFDVLSDFIGVKADASDVGDSSRVKLLGGFIDDKISSRRPIFDLRNSPHHAELFVCAYGERKDASISDSAGAVLLWNLAVRDTPEFSFVAPSPVCSAMISPFDPSVVVGASMSQPTEAIDLYRPTPAATKGPSSSRDFLACLCVGFADGETTKFLGGAEDGSLFEVGLQGAKSQVTDMYPGEPLGHSAPVTAIHWHPTAEKSSGQYHGAGSDLGHLVLTSSIDWTVKLWSSKLFGRGPEANEPLQTFEASEDAIFDVKWSPTHPGVFASLDAEENLDIWDLSTNMDTPAIRCPTSSPRLNCCRWSVDGRRVATADGEGRVKIWGIAPELCQAKPDAMELLNERIEEMVRSASQRR